MTSHARADGDPGRQRARLHLPAVRIGCAAGLASPSGGVAGVGPARGHRSSLAAPLHAGGGPHELAAVAITRRRGAGRAVGIAAAGALAVTEPGGPAAGRGHRLALAGRIGRAAGDRRAGPLLAGHRARIAAAAAGRAAADAVGAVPAGAGGVGSCTPCRWAPGWYRSPPGRCRPPRSRRRSCTR